MAKTALVCCVIQLASIAAPDVLAQDVSNAEEPLTKNIILQCDIVRSDYQYNYTLLYSFRRIEKLVGVISLYPENNNVIANALRTSNFNFPYTFSYKSFTGYIEIYDWFSGYEWYEGEIKKTRYYKGSVISRLNGSYSSWADAAVSGVCKEIARTEAIELIDSYNAKIENLREQVSNQRLF